MKEKTTLFSVMLFKKDESASLYQEEYSLSSFNYFKRTPIREMLLFLSNRVAHNLDTDVPQELIHKVEEGDSYKFFVKEKGGMIYVVAGLLKYPSNTLSLLIEDIHKFIVDLREGRKEEEEYASQSEKIEREKKREKEEKTAISKHIRVLMEEYQDFEQKDIMLQIKNELGKVEDILTKTIENALGRGEKIDELINSADSLSFQTKSLYRLSKKQNKKCCGIM